MKLLLFLSLVLISFAGKSQEMKEVMTSIYFGGGSWYIDQDQKVELKKLVESLPNLSYYDVVITSHTDNIGGKEFNEYLSRMRSQAAIQSLIKLNIAQEAIRYKDYGLENPVFDNKTNLGRMQNRRVDILFKPIQF